MSWNVKAKGASAADVLGNLDDSKRTKLLSQAVNKTARDARVALARAVQAEVAFPNSAVSAQDERLYISKYASPASLKAVITARGRATSLARFATTKPKVNTPGVTVEVEPGSPRFMARAFLIKLPQGTSPITDTQFNLALAVRLPKGQTLKNKNASRVSRGLYVLYGPSVAQVLENNAGTGVAKDMAPEIAGDLSAEIVRLLELS